MANIQKALNEEIRRLARKEIKAAVAPLQAKVAALRATVAEQAKRLAALERAAPEPSPADAPKPGAPAPAATGKLRFSPKALTAFRKKFNLSQRMVAKLLGTSLVSVNKWESGSAKPRQVWIAKFNDLRKKGLKEIKALLPDEPSLKKAPKAHKPPQAAPAPQPAEAAPETPAT
jgi:transcriptional regulator with XRE-family HTH domain